MNVLAVIPARGGSKRVPRKNLRHLAGRPMIAWSIDAARESRRIDRVVVSTDDEEIAAVARSLGAEPMMRPPEAASDVARIEAALWSVHQGVKGDYDYMVTLQPTCPVRRPGLVEACLERALYMDADAVFTSRSLMKCWLYEETTGAEWIDQMQWRRLGRLLQSQQARREDMLEMHDGSVCVSSRGLIEGHRDRIGGRAYPIRNVPTVDIDTEEDFAMAEALMAHRLAKV